MAYKDLHDEPFDETTITKLKLFEDYTKSWIPAFVMQKNIPEIHIFDLFAGTGYDLNGISGSPIRILQKIKDQKGNIYQNKIKIKVHLNEYQQKKYELLKEACNEFMSDDKSLLFLVEIIYYNEDFEILFPKIIPIIKKYPSLVFLDQNGIKFLSAKYFSELEKTSQTDFLYFVSSSFFFRFGETPEFKKSFNFDILSIKKRGYNQVHKSITEELRKTIPNYSKLKIYPFSLKKGTNIYGIIFGAKHPLAVDKFLKITWNYNGESGDANFDIDEESKIGQIDLFEGVKMTKIESFKQQVKDKILDGSIINNQELLNFVHENGHIGKHADEVVRNLKKSKLIKYNSNSPCVTYISVFKKKQIVIYEKV